MRQVPNPKYLHPLVLRTMGRTDITVLSGVGQNPLISRERGFVGCSTL